MQMMLYKAYLSVRTSLWLVPVICVVLGALVSFLTIAIDRSYDYTLVPASLVGGPDAALSILSTVATSMVSLATLVLTIVLVVVQLAMGQFSPRIVQRLLRDRPSQFAIGLFIATFVHTLLAIREVKLGDASSPGHVPGAAIVTTFILSIISIAILVTYVHHVGQALRVSALVELAGVQTRKLLDEIYTDKGEPTKGQVDPSIVTADKSGVLAIIAHKQLVKAARGGDCVLELLPALGEFVPAGADLFKIHGEPTNIDRKAVNGGVILRLERTLDQDVAYGIRLLVDVAERSISDSPWQDPTTAVQAIDRLHDCLRQLVTRPLLEGRCHDEDHQLRLIHQTMTWTAYVHLAFDELRLAGARSPQVARRLKAALQDLISIAPEDRRDVLETQLDMLNSRTARLFEDERELAIVQGADTGGLSVTGDST